MQHKMPGQDSENIVPAYECCCAESDMARNSTPAEPLPHPQRMAMNSVGRSLRHAPGQQPSAQRSHSAHEL